MCVTGSASSSPNASSGSPDASRFPDASSGSPDASSDSPDASRFPVASSGSPDASSGSPDASRFPVASSGSPDASRFPDASSGISVCSSLQTTLHVLQTVTMIHMFLPRIVHSPTTLSIPLIFTPLPMKLLHFAEKALANFSMRC